MSYSLESSWNFNEIKNIKESIRLGGLNIKLIKLVVPKRSIKDIENIFYYLQEQVAKLLITNNTSPPQNIKEIHFTLNCIWDLVQTNELFPKLSIETENQIIQLLERYRNDENNKNTSKSVIIPKTIYVQLLPGNIETEMKMNKFGYNCKLQLTVGKNKKISSIITHITKKWKIALLQKDYIQLSANIGKEKYIWCASDKNLTVLMVYKTLKSSGNIIKLNYEIISQYKTNYNDIIPSYNELVFTPSQEANIAHIMDKLENNKELSLDDNNQCNIVDNSNIDYINNDINIPIIDNLNNNDNNNNNIVSSNTSPLSQIHDNIPSIHNDSFEFPTASFPSPIAISNTPNDLLEQALPVTPFRSNTFDDISNDGFSPMTRSKKYEGKCREYWYQFEESVDYSSFYALGKRKREKSKTSKNSPSKKKRKLLSSVH